MKTFKIFTLGCKVNTFESECYYEELINHGFLESKNDIADIYIINTCTVTNTAASKSRQKIHLARKLNHNALICAVGCLVQTDSNLINESIDIFVGSSKKDLLVNKIIEFLKNKVTVNLVEDVSEKVDFDNLIINNYAHQTRAFLKIQDGCNQFCAYCQIPYARGRERSMSYELVKQNVLNLLKTGHQEIVLSGIHTGRYLDNNYHLIDILKLLVALDVKRIRISSIEITEITDEIIEFIKNNKQMALHLHIPLQAGSDKILKLMNRPYDSNYFVERINYIRKNVNNIAIGTDIIVGFPDESDDDFNKTLEVVKEANLNFIHAFPYSVRNLTKAATMKNQTSSDVKKERMKLLMKLAEKQKNNYLESFLDSDIEILFESKNDNYYFGHSSNYLKVYVESDFDLSGKFKKVHLVKLYKDGLYGRLI